MRSYHFSCFVFTILLIVFTYPSSAQTAANGEAAGATAAVEGGDVGRVIYYDVGRNITLPCLAPNPQHQSVEWLKNDSLVSEWSDLKDRYTVDGKSGTFTILGKTNEDDFGNYTCRVNGVERGWEVRGRTFSKFLSVNTNVVEGQKLKLPCKLTGKPYPNITWLYGNESVLDEVRSVMGDRVKFETSEQGLDDGVLVIEEAAKSDAGVFQCVVGDINNATTTLRVKDMYAALWPFLGICAEVFILCTIILVYEKRRTKPEMEDSDTDNHDQKKS